MTAPNIPSQTATAPANLATLDSWWLRGGASGVFVLKMQPTDLAGGTATLYGSTDTFRGAKAYPRLRVPSLEISILNRGWGLAGTAEGEGPVDYDQFKTGQMTYGSFYLINNDGTLDSWPDSYGWGDADCELLFGEKDDALGDLEVLAAFKVLDEPDWSTDEEGQSILEFQTKSAVVNPNGRIVTDVFAGSGGNEGGQDLEGQSKPRLYGKHDNINPPPLSDGNNGYMIDPEKVDSLLASGGATAGDQKVFQAGYPVGVAGTDYTDNVATDGTVDLARIPNTGPITVNANGWTGAGRTASALDYSLAANFTGLVVDQAGAAAPTVAGLTENGGVWLPAGADARYAEWLQRAIRPLGIYWTAQDGSKLYAGEIGSPEDVATPDATYTAKHISRIDKRQSPPPVWQVRLGWRPLGVALEASAAATEAEKARLAAPSRYVVAEDTSVKTDYPNALAITVETSLYVAGDASTLATELLNILKVKRDIFDVTMRRHPMALWIGQTAKIDLSDAPADMATYGLETTPKQMMVTGQAFSVGDEDPSNSSFRMEVWG